MIQWIIVWFPYYQVSGKVHIVCSSRTVSKLGPEDLNGVTIGFVRIAKGMSCNTILLELDGGRLGIKGQTVSKD